MYHARDHRGSLAFCGRPLSPNNLELIRQVTHDFPRLGLTELSRTLFEPAFLICTDPHLILQTLVQGYIYRWEIECNHRDEKSLLGVAQGQVRNPQAVRRLPQFQVAGYTLLLLASLLAYGLGRTAHYLPLPKWRRQSIRPSLLDLLNLLRQQILARVWSSEPRTSFEHFANPSPSVAKS